MGLLSHELCPATDLLASPRCWQALAAVRPTLAAAAAKAGTQARQVQAELESLLIR